MRPEDQPTRSTDMEILHDEFPCGLISFLPQGTILTINRTMAQWTGNSVQELHRGSFRSLLEPSSLIYYDLIIAPQLSLKGAVSEFSLKFSSSTGIYDALFSAQCQLDEHGNPLLIIASVQKVTTRKKYEAELLAQTKKAQEQSQLAQEEKRRFEFLFRSYPNKLWTVGPRGNILNINTRASQLLGSLPKGKLGGFAAVDHRDRPRTIALWRKRLGQGEKFERELRLRTPSGDTNWYLVTADPYYNQQNQIQMWFCTATNIHKQKLLQLANQHELRSHLSSAYRDLDEKSELLLEIAADQSHMVRKPLANILGLTALIQSQDATFDPQVLELLAQSARELDQMIRKVSGKTAAPKQEKP